MMHRTREFDDYGVMDLIKNDDVLFLLEALKAPSGGKEAMDIDYARYCLSDVIPTFDALLSDIAAIADKSGKDAPLVRKPNSLNAPIHYFVRYLSDHCCRHYGQPLHDVVAITTSVAFDRQDIDADYVRKLVKK
jgi:hypothetical protein